MPPRTPSMLPSAALAGIFVVVMAATTVSTPLYPLYKARFGLTPLEITVVFAAYGLGVMGGLVVTGVVSGLAQRVIVGAGLGLLAARAPADRRSQVASTYFLVLYTGLVDAGYVFCALVGAAAVASGLAVARRGGGPDAVS